MNTKNPKREAIHKVYEWGHGNVTGDLLWRLLHFLLPNGCLSCAKPLPAIGAGLGLCPACLGLCRHWPAGCPVCGCLMQQFDQPRYRHRCGACLQQPPPFLRLLCGWTYQPPFDTVITGLKFQGLDYLGQHLGKALLELQGEALTGANIHPEVSASSGAIGAPDLVVPVPLHWRRRLARGYNQAAEIAAPVAKGLGLPLRHPLRRRRSTPPQMGLDRSARRANLRDAFFVRQPEQCAGQHILLVDDVVTTGSTLTAAAGLLRRNGARAVTALVAARTPDPQEAADLARQRQKICPTPTTLA